MIQYYFPTAILAEQHPIMANTMLPIAKKYLADAEYTKIKWGYKTTYDYAVDGGLSQFPDMQNFTDFIEKIGRKYIKDLGYNADVLKLFTMVFASEMTKGNYHEMHTHPDSILSGLLYLQVPPESSPLIFCDPRPFRQFVHIPRIGESATNIPEIIVHPKNGLLLMWESWIPHLVPQTHNKEGRITLVFNICRKPA